MGLAESAVSYAQNESKLIYTGEDQLTVRLGVRWPEQYPSLPGAPGEAGHDGDQLGRANGLRHMYLEA